MEPKPETRKREVGEDIKDLEVFLRENFHEIIGIINAVRHGHSNYTENYPDLTPEGKEAVGERAKIIVQEAEKFDELATKIDPDIKQDVMFVSSPKPRAMASSDIIEAKFKEHTSDKIRIKDLSTDKGEVRTKKSLRAMDIHDLVPSLLLILNIAKNRGGWTPRRADYLNINEPEYEDEEKLWEKRSNVKDRFLGALSAATRTLKRYRETQNAIPRAVVSSHFEGLNPIVMEVFGLSRSEEQNEILDRAEGYTIYLLQSSDPDNIPMVIKFRDKTKKVIFNRETKQFT
ncbi:MAG: hypothetical protein ABID45_01580 [Patescibacteria group bacterium]